jgi:hypothetical protein
MDNIFVCDTFYLMLGEVLHPVVIVKEDKLVPSGRHAADRQRKLCRVFYYAIITATAPDPERIEKCRAGTEKSGRHGRQHKDKFLRKILQGKPEYQKKPKSATVILIGAAV